MSLTNKTVVELKALLKKKGLPVYGRKAELIARLEETPTKKKAVPKKASAKKVPASKYNMWSYKNKSTFSGILKGPMMFEIIVARLFDIRKSLSGQLEEAIVTVDDGYSTHFSLKKSRSKDGREIIMVNMERDAEFEYRTPVVKFQLSYDDSFDQAIDQMRDHLGVVGEDD